MEVSCDNCNIVFNRKSNKKNKTNNYFCTRYCCQEFTKKQSKYRLFKRSFEKARSASQRKGLEFNLDLEYLMQLWIDQGGKCGLSGVDLVIAETKILRKKGFSTASLDRMDSTQGYVPGNVRWTHKDINLLKSNCPDDLFIYICRCVSWYTREWVIDTPSMLDSFRWPRYNKDNSDVLTQQQGMA